VMINNADIVRDAQLVRYKDAAHIGVMSDEVYDSVIAVNQGGVFVCTRATAPLMNGMTRTWSRELGKIEMVKRRWAAWTNV